MPESPTGPRDHLEGVRTHLVGSRCPVCQEALLRGRQTVCSGRCWAKRWPDARTTTRDSEIRAALETIAALVQVTLGRLETYEALQTAAPAMVSSR
jgi:hypothetical protein